MSWADGTGVELAADEERTWIDAPTMALSPTPYGMPASLYEAAKPTVPGHLRGDVLPLFDVQVTGSSLKSMPPEAPAHPEQPAPAPAEVEPAPSSRSFALRVMAWAVALAAGGAAIGILAASLAA